MAEYIEREAAIATCKEMAACEWNHRVAPASWADAYEQFAEDVEDIPAADVVERKRGKWSYIGGDEWCCTNCGYVCSTEGRWEPMTANFCSECGADMRGE